ncbi:unnamed protein product [Adineta ricciae]|uniref:Uncharacterized protein n=1 Tax=Adineta ricciae TaxID=249248 RepID=A0A814GBC8_ADIRI|nr:unnamed protein product [Adineta ricciae]
MRVLTGSRLHMVLTQKEKRNQTRWMFKPYPNATTTGEPTQDEPSSKDYEQADQLFLLFNQLLTSAEILVDHIVTLDFNEYDDCSADYQEEDDNAVALNVDGIKYSCDTIKVTKLVTKNHLEDRNEILKSAERFVKTVKNAIPDYAEDHILNSDQSSFNHDNPSTRTLATTGEKIIKGHVKSMNAATHSYTIMPIISMAGKLIGPVFICLQEPTGKIGPRIKQSIYQASNIHVTCSNSFISGDCLLLIDSWSDQTVPSIYDDISTENITCKQIQIPPKTTRDIQPLDRYFFRQWKYLKQKIYDRVAMDQMDIDICSRNCILKRHCLIHNQFAAKRFSPLIKYVWYSRGYMSKDPGHFDSVHDSPAGPGFLIPNPVVLSLNDTRPDPDPGQLGPRVPDPDPDF